MFINQRDLDIERRLRAIEREVFPDIIHSFPLPEAPGPIDGPSPHVEESPGAAIARMREQAIKRLEDAEKQTKEKDNGKVQNPKKAETKAPPEVLTGKGAEDNTDHDS